MTTVFAGVLIGWAAIVALLFLFQRQLLYLPDPRPPVEAPLAAAGFRPLSATTADGLKLQAWYAPPAREDGLVVVLFHGNGGHHGYRLPALAPLVREGYGALLASYRGYGGNPGSPSEEGFYADGRAWLDVLASSGVASSRVVLWGESLGSGVATQMAVERPTAGVYLTAPFTSVVDRAQEIYWFLPARWLVRDRFDNLGRISRLSAPLLIVHGEQDRVIPPHHGRALLARASEPKRGVFLPTADHNDMLGHGIVDRLRDFLRTLRPAQ